MASPVKIYQREMHDNLGFFATWFPGDPIEIGDAGVLEGGRFRRLASLAELNIKFDIASGMQRQDVQYTSSQGTTITTSAGAKAAAVVNAEIKIEFSRSGAFVFHASALRQCNIGNRIEVANGLIRAFERGTWEKGWLLVEAVHVADRATIVVSEDSSAGLTLVASADAPLPGISLADPKVALTIAATRGKVVHVVGAKALHPLYSCLRLKDPLFRAPSLRPVRGAGAGTDEVSLSRPALDELLNS